MVMLTETAAVAHLKMPKEHARTFRRPFQIVVQPMKFDGSEHLLRAPRIAGEGSSSFAFTSTEIAILDFLVE